MYTFAISRGALHAMEEDGFKILERIRKLPSPRQVPATISIGISENVGSVKRFLVVLACLRYRIRSRW